jgi:hypothetical protein
MRRLATGIARRLICCTGMRDHVAAIMDGVRPIGLSDRSLLGSCALSAPRGRSSSFNASLAKRPEVPTTLGAQQ